MGRIPKRQGAPRATLETPPGRGFQRCAGCPLAFWSTLVGPSDRPSRARKCCAGELGHGLRCPPRCRFASRILSRFVVFLLFGGRDFLRVPRLSFGLAVPVCVVALSVLRSLSLKTPALAPRPAFSPAGAGWPLQKSKHFPPSSSVAAFCPDSKAVCASSLPLEARPSSRVVSKLRRSLKRKATRPGQSSREGFSSKLFEFLQKQRGSVAVA